MERLVTIVKVLVGLTLLAAATVSVAGPGVLTYQGLLTNGGGTPQTGTFSMTFSIYDALSGGTVLWTETQASVSVTNGLFSVQLGSSTPIPGAVLNGTDRYLGIKVGSDPEMTPRTPLSSVPYAVHASTVEGFSPGPGNTVSGSFGFAAGDSNSVLSDYSSVAGGSGNTVDMQNPADTTFDTTGLFDPLPPSGPGFSDIASYNCIFGPAGGPTFIGGGIGNLAVGGGSGV